jgi:hypothetical protein
VNLPPAYGRVTDPERFAPLHGYALELLSSLAITVDVETIEQHGLDPHLETTGVKRPSIRLMPNDYAAAPITVSFTDFPGLRMRFGQWWISAGPATVTVAPGRTAPDASAARPKISPVVCAIPAVAPVSSANANAISVPLNLIHSSSNKKPARGRHGVVQRRATFGTG